MEQNGSLDYVNNVEDLWVNTITGICHSVWQLNHPETLYTVKFVSDLVSSMGLDEHETPDKLPAPLAMEKETHRYSRVITSVLSNPDYQPAAFTPTEALVGETIMTGDWREMFRMMLLSAYPDYPGDKALLFAVKITTLLEELEVETRPAVFKPTDLYTTKKHS